MGPDWDGTGQRHLASSVFWGILQFFSHYPSSKTGLLFGHFTPYLLWYQQEPHDEAGQIGIPGRHPSGSTLRTAYDPIFATKASLYSPPYSAGYQQITPIGRLLLPWPVPFPLSRVLPVYTSRAPHFWLMCLMEATE